MLRVEHLNFSYDLLHVLWDIDLYVEEGDFVSLIGANGSGKSTLLKTIAGLCSSPHGRVLFEGKDISGMGAAKIARLGLCLVPEGRLLFPSLTVSENLELGAFRRYGLGTVFKSVLGTDLKSVPKEIARDREYVFELFPILKDRQNQKAESLSGGEAQMLAVGRGLMSKPKLLILDEPSLGLAPVVTKVLFKSIIELHRKGITVLLSEQNAAAGLRMADRAYVLERGRVILQGTGRELLENEDVKRSYLG